VKKIGMTKVRPKKLALLVLFLTSYVPLFVLLILRQIKQNREFLYFGGFSIDNFLIAIQKFGLSFFLLFLILFGLLGLKILLGNFKKKVDNGTIVKIKKIENKNSESIAYISTYIVPFIFQDTNNLFDIASIFIVLSIIFIIYIKSNMIVINPILNITHSLYQIEFNLGTFEKTGLLISNNKDIETNMEIKINQISSNIYYG
jgi:hypothetical protein